jgi:putative peptide maturation dehydrogenase
MLLRRPRLLFLQCRERAEFSMADLLDGGTGVVRHDEWVALAPHLGSEVRLEPGDVAVFEAVTHDQAQPRVAMAATFGAARIDRMVEVGLLIGEHDGHALLRERERKLGEVAWWGPAALVQTFGRWQGVDVQETGQAGASWQEMVEAHGAPPPEVVDLRPHYTWLSLPAPERTALDSLFESRSTCRTFDATRALPVAGLAAVLHRVFGAQAVQTLAPDAVALKKNSPSGGGLHPIDAYVLVQNVAGIAPGVYHYQCVQHALEPMQLLAAEQATALARELVAGQGWFANAPVLVLMAARFQRNFWKYRQHAKAWRVLQLDAGHLSQNLYLAATELGYGAFITAAINDACAERLFELDGISTGAIAVCGFGRRSDSAANIEFDPLGRAVR